MNSIFLSVLLVCISGPARAGQPPQQEVPERLYRTLLGNPAQDAAVLGELRVMYPDSPEGMYAAAALFHEKNLAEIDTPLSLLDRALALKPGMGFALAQRGIYLLRKKDSFGAVRDFTAALALGARPQGIYYYRALAYEMSGDVESALRDWAHNVQLSRSDMDGYVLGERLFRSLGRPREANWCLFKAAEARINWRKPFSLPGQLWDYFKYGWVLDNVDPDIAYIASGEGSLPKKELEGKGELLVAPVEEEDRKPPESKPGERLLMSSQRTLASFGGFQKLYAAMAADLFLFKPELGAKYKTEAQRRAFAATAEYAAGLKEMSDTASQARGVLVTADVRVKLSPYDNDLEGFYLPVATNHGLRSQAHHPANWGGFYIQALPTISLPADAAPDQPRDYYLFIHADARLKAALQRAAPALTARILARPDFPGQSPEYKYLAEGAGGRPAVFTIADECISVSDAGLLLLDGQGTVLYSQSFY
ncbi:MAG: hypothetical protein GX410_10975 [Elusimicrobia bacterium]|nr:hypothetical protein [Elusimicrobiota bacterium]